MGRVIGIDFGLKRTGIAVTDESRTFAFPLETLPTATVFKYIQDYCGKEVVDGFVVGEPRRLDNSATDATKHVEKFVTGLGRKFEGKFIDRVDERFTSSLAKHALIESGVKKSQRRNKAMLDVTSATIILQSWIEQNELSKR